MKKKIILALIFSCLFTQQVYADKVYVGNGRINYSAEFEKSGGEAILNIMKNGKSFDDQTWEKEDVSDIIYFGMADVGENKTALFKIALSVPGKYSAELSYNSEIIKENIIYIEKKEFDSAVAALNTSKNDVAALADKLSSSQTALGLWSEFYDTADMDKVAKILSKILEKEELSASKPEDVLAVMEKCFVIDALNSGKISNIENYKDVIQIPDMIMENLWISEKAEDITKKISNKDFLTSDEITETLEEAAALTKIRYADGYGDVIDVVKLLSDKIGVSKISESCARKIQNKDYADYDELKEAIKAASDTTNNGGGSSGGGGSSWGTQSTSKKNNSVAIGLIQMEKPQIKDEEVQARRRFTDIDSVEWAADDIEKLAVLGIVNGKTETEFCPQDKITREEFLTLIVKTFNINVVGDVPEFADVTKDKWFYDYVVKAYNCGIVKGISETEFGSGKNITRQDLAVMVYNVLKLCDVEFKESEMYTGFEDERDISEYAKDAVNAMKAEGIMIGNNNRFNPKSHTTRAEAAKVIHTLLKYSKEGSGI